MQIEQKRISDLQKEILAWYAKHQRALPWRKTRDAYKILVSEVMLQQTQVSRVIPKYTAWLERFPGVADLAEAKISDVLQFWSGLGYNRRALNLKKTAEIITREYGCVFPQDESAVLKLPGIGKYTARAILCFAFNKQVAVVDTNVKKVILTQFFKPRTKEAFLLHDSGRVLAHLPETQFVSGEERHDDSRILDTNRLTDQEVWQLAEQILPAGKAYEWNQALMDYAATMLMQEKIVIPKQSTFIGSQRYYRGRVLKTLLGEGEMAIKLLGVKIKEDYQTKDEVWLQSLVNDLEKEGFIKVVAEKVSLL